MRWFFYIYIIKWNNNRFKYTYNKDVLNKKYLELNYSTNKGIIMLDKIIGAILPKPPPPPPPPPKKDSGLGGGPDNKL